MKIFFYTLAVFFASATLLFAASRPESKKGLYWVWGLTGDSLGTLDSLHITGDGDTDTTDGVPNQYDLIEGDAAIYINITGTTVTFYSYAFDASGTDATDSPDIVRPNDYSTAGVWRKNPDTQPLSAILTAIAGLTPAANAIIGWNDSTVIAALTSLDVDVDLGVQSSTTAGRLGRTTGDQLTMGNNSGSATLSFSPTDDTAGDGDTDKSWSADKVYDELTALDDDAIEFVIDGGGSAITTGQKGHLEIPWNCTINSVTVLADQTGSIVVDLWVDSYANFPPADADSITASAPPTLSSDVASQDSTLTGWTTSLTKGQIIAYNVDSASTVQRVTISLKVDK